MARAARVTEARRRSTAGGNPTGPAAPTNCKSGLGSVALPTAHIILGEQAPPTGGISCLQPEGPDIGGRMVHETVAKGPRGIREGEDECIAPRVAGCVRNGERRAEPIEPVHNVPAGGAVDPDEDAGFV